MPDGSLLCGVAAGVVIDADSGSAAGLEAKVNVEHAEKAAQQQTCADQQHAGEGDLTNYKCGANAVMPAALAGSVAPVFEGPLQAFARHAKSRCKAEENRGCDGDGESPGESCSVYAYHAEQRKRERDLVGKPGKNAPGEASGPVLRPRWLERGLGEELAQMRLRPAPERGAHGELFLQRSGAGQQQVGEIDANDKQNEAHSAPQHIASGAACR